MNNKVFTGPDLALDEAALDAWCGFAEHIPPSAPKADKADAFQFYAAPVDLRPVPDEI